VDFVMSLIAKYGVTVQAWFFASKHRQSYKHWEIRTIRTAQPGMRTEYMAQQ
jgi:hypothetical protein